MAGIPIPNNSKIWNPLDSEELSALFDKKVLGIHGIYIC